MAFSTWHTTFAPPGRPLHPDVAQLESQLPGSLCSPLKRGVLRSLQGLGHHVQALLLLPALQFLEERGSRSPVSCWGCRWGQEKRQSLEALSRAPPPWGLLQWAAGTLC